MFRRSRSMLAIDLGSTAVRVIETGGRGNTQLKVLGSAPTGDLIDRSGFIRDEYELQRLLSNLLKSLEIEIESRPCAIALTSSAVSIKKVNLDAESALQPREQMRYLAEQSFEQDIRNLQLSLKIMGPSTLIEGGLTALLIGARRDVLEQRMSTLRACGLNVAVVDCAAICFYNALLSTGSFNRGSHLLVNVGHSAADVAIIQDGLFVFHKNLGLAGRDYTDDVARKLGISFDSAEKVKLMISSGTRPAAPDLLQLIRSNNDELVDGIESAISQWWKTRESGAVNSPLQSGFLTGGGTMMLGLRKAIEDGVGLTTTIFNPFEALTAKPNRFDQQHLNLYGHTYSVAVGLALHSKVRRGDA